MANRRVLPKLLLFGMAACGMAVAQAPATPAPSSSVSMSSTSTPPAVTCSDLRQCKGPKLHGKQFALLTATHARVAARGERWGDYLRVQLILSNSSPDAVSFDPKGVVALTASGTALHPAVVTELDQPRQGPGIMLGSGDPTGGYYPTVMGGVNPHSVIRIDPVGDAANNFDKLMQQHSAELGQMLNKQLTATTLSAGETLAGYVLFQPTSAGLPVQVRVAFAGNEFLLPIAAK